MENLCNLCPRNCNVDRTKKLGFCLASNNLKVAKVMLHHWEEPIISGNENSNGSGAIFFSNCNLKCVFCQNYEISSKQKGNYTSIKDLAETIKELELKKANNINFVTPTHYTSQIIEALKIYKPNIPIVWNTSGYEKPETIEKLKGYVDIYLTDFKYFSNDLSFNLSKVKDYFNFASQAILKMRKQQPVDVIKNGLMKKGVIIRILVLPNHIDDAIKILEWIKENLGTKTIISVMSQYMPTEQVKEFSDLNRTLKPLEYKIVLNKAIQLGFENIYSQDLSSNSSEYVPDFN